MHELITLYQQRLNLQDATFTPITHEDASVAVVYKVIQPNGEQYILKVCTRSKDYFNEMYFLKYFAGKLPIPRIIKSMEPEISSHGAILMEYLPGNLLNLSSLSNHLAYELGSLLGHIHSNRTEGYGDITQPHSLNPYLDYNFTLKFEEGIAECNNHLSKALLEQCRRYYDTHIKLLALVDGPCIVHRDFRPGNIIIKCNNIQGIIDWASGGAGFAEEDFCSLEHGIWSIDSISKEAFLAGYASLRPVPEYGQLMPLLRLSKAIASIGFTVKTETWQNKNARFYQFNRQFLEDFMSFFCTTK